MPLAENDVFTETIPYIVVSINIPSISSPLSGLFDSTLFFQSIRAQLLRNSRLVSGSRWHTRGGGGGAHSGRRLRRFNESFWRWIAQVGAAGEEDIPRLSRLLSLVITKWWNLWRTVLWFVWWRLVLILLLKQPFAGKLLLRFAFIVFWMWSLWNASISERR